MISEILLDCIDSLNQYEVNLVCETLKTLFATHETCPFNIEVDERGWTKAHISNYLNSLEEKHDELNITYTASMCVMSIITTVIVQKRLLK